MPEAVEGQIDTDDLEHLEFFGYGDADSDSALLAFYHGEAYHFYRVRITSWSLPKKGRFVAPLPYGILDHYKMHTDAEDVKRELAESDEEVTGFLMQEEMPLRRSLKYKLNLAVFSFVLCANCQEM